MKINPFELHPDIEPPLTKSGEKNSLTKQEIYAILDKKLVEITNKNSPTWGYNKYTVINILFALKKEVEEIT